jgi:hypothetical protein
MDALVVAAWGAFGGFAVEGLEITSSIRRTGRWPWRVKGAPPFPPFIASVVIRLSIAAGVAVAFVSGGQVSGALGALSVGVMAPLLVEKLAQLPLSADSAAGTDDVSSPPLLLDYRVDPSPASLTSHEVRDVAGRPDE